MDGVRRGGPYSAKAKGKGGKGGGKQPGESDIRRLMRKYSELAFGGPCNNMPCKGKGWQKGKNKRMAIWTRMLELLEADGDDNHPEDLEPPTKNLLAKLRNQYREFKDETQSLWDQLKALDQEEALQEEAQEEAAASSSSNDSAAAGAATATSNDYWPGQFMSLLQ